MVNLNKEQYAAVKTLINSLITGAESILESEFSNLEEEHPDLYHALVEFQECWDSTNVKDALDIWFEDLDN